MCAGSANKYCIHFGVCEHNLFKQDCACYDCKINILRQVEVALGINWGYWVASGRIGVDMS